MKLEQIYNKLKKIAPIARLHFDNEQKLPFLIYGLERKTPVMADNTVFYDKGSVWLEIYTKELDLKFIKKIENLFVKNKIPFRYDGEEFLRSEKMYLTVFKFEFEE